MKLEKIKLARLFDGTIRAPFYKLRYAFSGGFLFKRLYLLIQREVLRAPHVATVPTTVKINTGYVCNLRCPHCPTGLQMPGRTAQGPIPKKDLTLEGAQFIASRLRGVHSVLLFGWGEPFLNKDIFGIIDHFRSKRKYVSVDTNLSIKNEAIVDKIADSGIHFVSVSLDGADEESYQQYRVRGSFDLVVENIKKIVASPNRPKRIEWQYIVSKKNRHRLDAARELAASIGIPLRVFDIGLYQDYWYNHSSATMDEWWTDEQKATFEGANEKPAGGVCHYMYDGPFIDTDAKIYPCCHAPHAPASVLEEGYANCFGDLHENSLKEIWNNDYYRKIRSAFAGKPDEGPDVKPICLQCRVYLRATGQAHDSLPEFSDETIGRPVPASTSTR